MTKLEYKQWLKQIYRGKWTSDFDINIVGYKNDGSGPICLVIGNKDGFPAIVDDFMTYEEHEKIVNEVEQEFGEEIKYGI